MIGLDTNVLVRYFVRDDDAQSKLASKFIKSNCTVNNSGFINLIALCELVWVLESAYDYEKNLIVAVIEKILRTNQFIVENSDCVWKALAEYSAKQVDFADALISVVNQSSGCKKTISFDKKASKFLKNFELIC